MTWRFALTESVEASPVSVGPIAERRGAPPEAFEVLWELLGPLTEALGALSEPLRVLPESLQPLPESVKSITKWVEALP